MSIPLVRTLNELAAVLGRLRIPYLIGGSLASGVHGIGRTTFDVDLVARVSIKQVEQLAASLGKDWYVDIETARTGIPAGRSFNIIHTKSGDKFDIFPANSGFHMSQLERAVRTAVEFAGEAAEYPVATAEDILLAKLQWFQSGGEVSERQWNDILGIISHSRVLDREYMDYWATVLGVAALLSRALAAGKESSS